ncbi:MAG: hypothetical protein ACRC0V_13035 [Fusobacteriaceae bacterium]
MTHSDLQDFKVKNITDIELGTILAELISSAIQDTSQKIEPKEIQFMINRIVFLMKKNLKEMYVFSINQVFLNDIFEDKFPKITIANLMVLFKKKYTQSLFKNIAVEKTKEFENNFTDKIPVDSIWGRSLVYKINNLDFFKDKWHDYPLKRLISEKYVT